MTPRWGPRRVRASLLRAGMLAMLAVALAGCSEPTQPASPTYAEPCPEAPQPGMLIVRAGTSGRGASEFPPGRITATPDAGEGRTADTDRSGCAFFAALPPGDDELGARLGRPDCWWDGFGRVDHAAAGSDERVEVAMACR